MSPVGRADWLSPRDYRVSPGPPTDRGSIILEGWAEGFMLGALAIMAGITIANMRKGVLLHKLILLELLLGGWQGYNLFWSSPEYGWWLSVAATCLHISNGLHNVISWLKIRPFLSKKSSWAFIGTVILVQPYWVLEIYATFVFFTKSNGSHLFLKTRPIETIFRDPWWVAASIKLVWTLKVTYEMTFRQVVTISPRFAIMLFAMALSMIFVLLDILSVTGVFSDALPVGVNPFWKLALVFKCLTDTVVLDDFKTVLDRLWALRTENMGINAPLVPRELTSSGKGSNEQGDQLSVHSTPRSGGTDSNFEMRQPGRITRTVQVSITRASADKVPEPLSSELDESYVAPILSTATLPDRSHRGYITPRMSTVLDSGEPQVDTGRPWTRK